MRWSGGSSARPLPRADRDASIPKYRFPSTSPIRTEVTSDAVSYSPEPMSVFLYVGSEKAALYRAIMRVFVESRERFSYHLRAEQVAAALPTSDSQSVDHREIESALAQLCQWGNLETDAEP